MSIADLYRTKSYLTSPFGRDQLSDVTNYYQPDAVNPITDITSATMRGFDFNSANNTPNGLARFNLSPRLSQLQSTVGDYWNRFTSRVDDATKTTRHNYNSLNAGNKAMTTLGGVGTLLNAYNAYKANKLAKQQLSHAIDVHNKNWDAQRKQTNSQLEDRQTRRVAEAQASGRTTTSVADYMAKYGI